MLHTVSNSLIKIQLQKFFKMPGKCECGCNERVAFKGMFKKGHQPEGTSRDPEGHLIPKKRQKKEKQFSQNNLYNMY